MSSNSYIQLMAIIVVMALLSLLSETINSVINLLGSALMISIISWKLNGLLNRYLISRQLICTKSKAVIITGCDSGFGNQLVCKLNQLGFHTIALCLNADGEGAKQLCKTVVFPNKLSIIQVNITDESQIDTSYEDTQCILRANDLKLWALVNNAGVFHIGFVEWDNDIEGYRRTLNVNTLGTIQMTKKYLPLLRDSGGRVINVLSGASRIALEGVSAYTASKYASLGFTDSLRREMFRFGVKVISVEPSCYRTPMAEQKSVNSILDKVWSDTPIHIRNDYGNESFEKFKVWYAMQSNRARDPQEVVTALTDAVFNKNPQIRYRCSGPLVTAIATMSELLPTELFDDFWRKINMLEIITE